MSFPAASSAASAAAAFLRDIISTGAPLELDEGKEQWKPRHFRFNPNSGALESYRGGNSAVQTSITLRRFQVVNSAASDPARFLIKTPSRIFKLRAQAGAKPMWLQWLGSMQRDQALIDQRARVSAGGQAHWIPDAESDYCAGCGKAFALTRRRHHCRDCGFCLCSAQTCLVSGSKTCQLCVREKSLGGRVAAAQALADRAIPTPVPDSAPTSPVAPRHAAHTTAGAGAGAMMGLADVPVVTDAAGTDGARARKGSKATAPGKLRRRQTAVSQDPTAAPVASADTADTDADAAASDDGSDAAATEKPADKWVFVIIAIGILFWLYSALATPSHVRGAAASGMSP
jgi:hypothetical protein